MTAMTADTHISPRVEIIEWKGGKPPVRRGFAR